MLVGDGKLKVWPAVVWVTANVVSTSTVVAAVPIVPPAAKLAIVAAVLRVDPLLVNWLPLTTKVPLKVVAPVTAKVPLKLALPVTPRLPPSVVAPVPTLNGLAPVTEVEPLRETEPVPVLNVPAPV